MPGVELFAQATADDMYTSIRKLTDKLKRQLAKHRKIQCSYQHELATFELILFLYKRLFVKPLFLLIKKKLLTELCEKVIVK